MSPNRHTASALEKDSAVHLAPVADLHHEYAQSTVLNVANHPAIAHSVAPETSKWPGQCLARATWVFPFGDAFIHEVHNAPRRLLIELA